MTALGSVRWWLRHELRLAGRELVLDFGQAALFIATNLLVLAYGGAHVVAWLVLAYWDELKSDIPLSTMMLIALVTACAVQGFRGGYRALFGRRDGELLLASALSIRKVLWARLIAITLSSLATPLFWLSPFANVQLLLGHGEALALYPAALGIAFIAASLSVALLLVTLRLVGHEGFRFLSRSAMAILLAGLMLSGPLSGVLEPFQPDLDHALTALNWLGQAFNGSLAPLSAVLAAGVIVFLVTPFLLEKAFQMNLGQPGPNELRTAPARSVPLSEGLLHRLILKEWRLLWRDGSLMSQLFLSLCLASTALALLLSQRGIGMPLLIGGVVVYAAGNLCSDLSWLALSAEPCPWLVATAPRPSRVVTAKIASAILPIALLLFIAALVLGGYRVEIALQVLGFGLLSCACVSILNSTFATPGSRADVLFGRRQKNRLLAIADIAICISFAIAVPLASPGLKAIAVLLPILLVATVAAIRKTRVSAAGA